MTRNEESTVSKFHALTVNIDSFTALHPATFVHGQQTETIRNLY